jgi:hypothetical protein
MCAGVDGTMLRPGDAISHGKLIPIVTRDTLTRKEASECLVDIGRSYNVRHSTISRL